MDQKQLLSKEWFSMKKEGTVVFPSQKEIGKKIVAALKEKTIVTLCAPPQWGKTGVSLFVSYHMCMSLKKKKIIDYRNVFFITGMSDKTWVDQTTERVLPCWRKNVFHRNTLHRLKTKITEMKEKNEDRNILLLVDECHIANKKEHLMSEIMDSLGKKQLRKRNIKIVQISATPSNALIDADEWSSRHQMICPEINLKDGYVSFKTFLLEDRIHSLYELSCIHQCGLFMNHMKKFSSPKYHFVRAVSKGKTGYIIYGKIEVNLRTLCNENHFSFIEMNGETPKNCIQDIYNSLSLQPERHTLILIKDMLGAAKTIDDSYLGCIHESTPSTKDYSSEVQGLPGRLCGWGKQKGKESPLLFCDQGIIEQYIEFYESGFDYRDEYLEWKDGRMKITLDGKITSSKSYIHK